jgi:hypothetical protein
VICVHKYSHAYVFVYVCICTDIDPLTCSDSNNYKV